MPREPDLCGTDLHFVRGTVPGLEKGRILGHEAVGVVEQVGKGIRNLRARGKNLAIKAGDSNHRRYIPKLVELVASGSFDPTEVLTQVEPMSDVIDAYKAFDRRAEGWIKVELKPSASRPKTKRQEAPARPRVKHEEGARA